MSTVLEELLPSTKMLETTVSSKSSKNVVELLLRNAHGGTLYSVLFGRGLPQSLISDVRKVKHALVSGKMNDVILDFVPPYASIGDILHAGSEEETHNLETWFYENIAPLPLSDTTEIDKRGAGRLLKFYDEVLRPHVIDKHKWTNVDTMLVALILFSYHDFEPVLHKRYASSLGAGVVPALHRYRLDMSAEPLSIDSRNFDVAMIFHILHHVLPN